ncbi:MAG: nodulation protein NodH [Rhodobacterales bacterium]|nr:MAG: nodulation protein NodH [Rhodobacterales bacterium]
MRRRFDAFVIFAEMRTGSNFLESTLDLFPGLQTYGEAFNPFFLVRPGMKALFDISLEARNEDPVALFDRMKQRTKGIPGFRFFHDHDRRIFERVIGDPACAKVVLTRNFVEAYVSRAIAKQTNQWALGNVKHAKKAKAVFVEAEFTRQLGEIKAFQLEILGRLQETGQTAFYINYDDLRDIAKINGLARFLGEESVLEGHSDRFKKQNPEPLDQKVENFAEMAEAVAKIGAFDLEEAPNFEPRRAAAVPGYVAAREVPLLYLPVQAGPVEEITGWMAGLDGGRRGALISGMNQKALRKWKRQHPGHRSFTVLRHPVARAHAAFCTHFLSDGPGAMPELKKALIRQYDVPLPENRPDAGWTRAAHRAAFLAFLGFLARNLAGQTPFRVAPSWASQSRVLAGFSPVIQPDHVLREDKLAEGLRHLGEDIGRDLPPAPEPLPDRPHALEGIYDSEAEAAVRAVYQRDYMQFGFCPWVPADTA